MKKIKLFFLECCIYLYSFLKTLLVNEPFKNISKTNLIISLKELINKFNKILFNKLKYRYSSIPSMVVVLLLLTGCVSENAEELFPTNDVAATAIYDSSLKSIIENKCINCHVYHLEGTNRYDTYEKTKSSIGQMLERINATSNISMPPDESPQLTEEEKLVFLDFFNVLNSDDDSEDDDEIKLTFTAYKYPIFEERVGVSGTFRNIQYQLNEDYTEPIHMLQDATVNIETSLIDLDGPEGLRTMNIKNHFFAFFSPSITGQVISYNETEAIISFTMNNNTHDVNFNVSIEDDKLVLKGTIDDLNLFNWTDAYDELEVVCGELHENKVWPDLDLEVVFPID